MIVATSELTTLERLALGGRENHGLLAAESYVKRHPHLILPCGFDEVRIEPLSDPFEDPENDPGFDPFQDKFLKLMSRDEALTFFRHLFDSIELKQGLHCRLISSGIWYQSYRPSLDPPNSFAFDRPLYLAPRAKYLCLEDTIVPGTIALDVRTIVSCCRDALKSPDHFGAIILPNLWIPPEVHPRIELIDVTRDILTNLRSGATTFADLTWRQLEELVAELLRARGMDVSVTPASGDGGRDVVARGELIPGEPVVLAVEVKHRDVVRLDDVRSRLYANSAFPALLFATSGRFSAGVIREKRKPENFLRMFLKDGVALRQWIDDYVPQIAPRSDRSAEQGRAPEPPIGRVQG